MKNRPWIVAAFSLVVLIATAFSHEINGLFHWYSQLHRDHSFRSVETFDKVGGALVCIVAVWIFYRGSLHNALQKLGLCGNAGRAALFGAAVSLPMLIGFAFAYHLQPVKFVSVLFLDFLSPLVEEMEFRGFGVLQLQSGTRWPFWIAVWPSSILFGYDHIKHGGTSLEMLELFLLTGFGAVAIAWLAYRWESLWVAILLHVCMNLWWDIFSISNNAIGGWFPFALQISAIMVAIVGTLKLTRPRTNSAHSLGMSPTG